MDVIAGNLRIPYDHTATTFAVRNLSTVMAGAFPVDIPIEIISTATNMASYTFSLADGGYLVTMWTDGIAVDHDPGVETTLTIPGVSASQVIGIDILYGMEQELVFEMNYKV